MARGRTPGETVRGTVRHVLLVALHSGSLAGAILLLAQPDVHVGTSAPATLTNSFVAAKPVLPKVERRAAGQPPLGVRADRHLDRTPPRLTTSLDFVKMGWSYNCMECHKLIPATWHFDRPLSEHEHIRLEHGNNRFCLNCHHPTNRMAFVDYDGSEIAEGDVSVLCAKCHGTTYRDWQAGAHGRRNGYWKASLGVQTRLRCIQCHDPHQPKFQPMQPMPPLRYPERAPHGQSTAAERPHTM